MRKLILLALLLIAAHLAAQTPPPQFAGLMTNDTNYTSNGTVWTTPTVPDGGTSGVTDSGSCLTDATWLTTSCRMPNPTSCPVNSTYNPTGDCTFPMYTNDYSKTVPWSNDDQYFMGHDESGWLYLYSVSSSNVYTFVRWVQTYGGHVNGTGDHNSIVSMQGDESNWLWANNSATPHLMYYTGSSTTNNVVQLKSYNADTNTASVVHDFTTTIAGFSGCLDINMMREGNQSDDDRYWAFSCNGSGGDNDSKGVFVYDKTTDSVIATATLGAGGLCGTSACPVTPNWIGMSPSGTYVIINWNGTAHVGTYVRGLGTEAYTRSLTYVGVLDVFNSHADVGYDANGVEVYVTVPDDAYDIAYTELAICKISASSSSPGTTSQGGCQHVIQMPGGLTWPGMYLISMRGTHGTAQGWMLFSTGDSGTTSTGQGGYGTMENFAVPIDWATAGTDVNSPASVNFIRLSRTRAVNAETQYTAQPNGVPDRTFTRFAYTSTWDVNPATLTYQPFYSMYVTLGVDSPSSAVQVTASATPSPATAGQPVTLTATVAQNGSSVPTGSINFLNGSASLGQASLDSEGTATLVLSSLSVGSYNVIAAYSGDSNYPAGESGSVPLQVLSTTTASLTASPNPVSAGQTLTLTATLTGDGSVWPTGTVTFLNGSTLLGTATLDSSGVATLSTSSLAAGTYSLTAQYAGNANFLSSTSAAASVTVNSQATAGTGDQGFSLSSGGNTPSQTVQPGEAAVYTLSVSPALGATLPAITFTASGLPEGSTATFSPKTIAAGSGATNVTLSIQVPAQSAMLGRDRKLNGGLSLVAFGILLLPFGGRIRRSGKRMLRLSCMVLLLAGAASLVGLSGCTAPVSRAFPSSSPQTYTITVTTTSASLSQTTNVTLIVE